MKSTIGHLAINIEDQGSLLSETQESISQIALECGFSDPSERVQRLDGHWIPSAVIADDCNYIDCGFADLPP